jgi:pimeloyl-ACP methyl ester carboxylesterase
MTDQLTDPAAHPAPDPARSAANPLALRHINLHGHDVGYRMAGEGPAIVLVHGLTGSSTTWRSIMPELAKRYTVLAPDLLGHGESAKPRGDYSLGAFASGVRDLMVALGIEHATVVGHSLGGGVAMQLAYQFPQRCERLVLVASGGLGKEVNPALRAVSLPGSELVLPVIFSPYLRDALAFGGEQLARLRIPGFGSAGLGVRGKEMWRSYTGLTEVAGRTAFIHTVRSVIDVFGQRVSARDRLYLAQEIPTLIVWGDRDHIIPVAHAHVTHELIPGSDLAIVEGAGHFLPFEDPDAFLAALMPFLSSTEPARNTDDEFRDLLLGHEATLTPRTKEIIS